jgi:hypothetical protein
MFVRYVFAKVMWRPLEHGACLIIDDPLLKARYGCCDFRTLLNHMKTYGFTTNIAFIPWNRWRTSKREAAFFRRESGSFSVSIHGCDHTAAEFGAKPYEEVAGRARLAQSRMRDHEAKTGIQHDPIMIFPQGVYSKSSVTALNRTGYMAAVNTEVSPVGDSSDKTLVRDVWDVAITRHGSLPIFTRRYAHHGLENFAFDLLLGKPCLIVAHHDFFKNKGRAVIELVQRLSELQCNLRWRPLGEVLRRACRYRITETGIREYCMYASELWVENADRAESVIKVRKREDDPDVVRGVNGTQEGVEWKVDGGCLAFSSILAAGERRLFKIKYREQPEGGTTPRNLRYELQVATRRILSEMRDESIFQKERLKEVACLLRDQKK